MTNQNESESPSAPGKSLGEQLQEIYPSFSGWLERLEKCQDCMAFWASRFPSGRPGLENQIRLWNESGRQEVTWQYAMNYDRMIASRRKLESQVGSCDGGMSSNEKS